MIQRRGEHADAALAGAWLGCGDVGAVLEALPNAVFKVEVAECSHDIATGTFRSYSG